MERFGMIKDDDNVPIVLVWIFAAFCAATVYGITYLAFLL
jgi:hypothetical protein